MITAPGRRRADRTGPERTEPDRAGPGGSNRAGPGRAGPGQAGPGQAGPGRAGPGRTGPAEPCRPDRTGRGDEWWQSRDNDAMVKALRGYIDALSERRRETLTRCQSAEGRH